MFKKRKVRERISRGLAFFPTGESDDAPPVPFRRDAGTGLNDLDTIEGVVTLSGQDDLVGSLVPERGLDRLEHLFRDAEVQHDLLAEHRSRATIAEQGVQDVDDESTSIVVERHAAGVGVEIPEEFHTSGYAEGVARLYRSSIRE